MQRRVRSRGFTLFFYPVLFDLEPLFRDRKTIRQITNDVPVVEFFLRGAGRELPQR